MILLLTGANDFAIRQALDSLVAVAVQKHGVHAITRVDGETLDPSQLPDLLQGGTLFASERLVIMRDVSKNKNAWDAIGDWVQKTSAEITAVLVEGSPDKRTRTYKQIQKYGKVQEFAQQNEAQLAQWVVKTAEREGATIDARAASYLVRQVGLDQWQVATELNKLIAAGTTITTEVIDRLVEPNPQASAFDLLDAVLQGKVGQAAQLLNRLKTTEDPYRLFGLVVSQVHTLAIVASATGKSADAIAKEAGIHPFVVRKMQPLARGGAGRLRGIIDSVALADTHMKSTGADPWILLEQCLGKIAKEK